MRWFLFIFFLLLLSAVTFARGPVVLPVAGDYNIAFSDVQFIKYTLSGILLSVLGFILKWAFELIFKKQSSVDSRLEKIVDSLSRLETKFEHLDRHAVRKEDLLVFVRAEMQYRESVRNE